MGINMKKNQFFEYQGYLGEVNFSEEDNLLFGKVLFIKDLISYEGQSVKELKTSFIKAIDEYLNDCATVKKNPDKPFKGSFNIRIGEKLHREVALSLQENQSINSFIKEAIKKALNAA